MGKQTRKIKQRIHYALGTLGILLVAIGAYALFMLVNQGMKDLLHKFGVENFYLQMGIIILIALFGLYLSGFNFWRAFRKLAKNS